MKAFISIALASAALVAGLLAALYWYRSSIIGTDPVWSTEPGNSLSSQMGWVAGMMEAMAKSAKLNKSAAIWTAVSVLLGAASSFVGALA